VQTLVVLLLYVTASPELAVALAVAVCYEYRVGAELKVMFCDCNCVCGVEPFPPQPDNKRTAEATRQIPNPIPTFIGNDICFKTEPLVDECERTDGNNESKNLRFMASPFA